jgi:coniferyl-aldehyde dehydrogenase
MNPADINGQLLTLFERQRAAFEREPYPSLEVRRDRLQRLRTLLVANAGEIEAAIDADFGRRPEVETQLIEIFPALEEVKAALRHGKAWMKPRRVGVSKWYLPASGRILPQPVGIIGVIVPWNYPVFLSIGPLAGVLAAGNRAMVKVSEFTPAFGECFARLVSAAFAPEEIAVVTGDADVAASFSALPFDHLVFTGSTHVGRKVMAAAAANLTPVTLELGGKSPAVVAPDYPIAHAAARILTGKLMNAGQTCIAPDYVLVARSDLAAFVAAAHAQARAMYPRGLLDEHYCSVVNARQYARLTGYLDQAQAAGARIEMLFDGAARDEHAQRLAPVIVVDPAPELDLMREELFGPVLPVLPYDSVDDAVRFINERPRPLAMYWFDRDRTRTEWALRRTHAGGVTINDVLLHIAQHNMPFGGIGPSGIGHYHGRWGFDTFSKLKPVFHQSRLNLVSLFGPPYRPLARRLTTLMQRF